ncbi:hypothetical protein ACFXTO_034566 [Malus domestica]
MAFCSSFAFLLVRVFHLVGAVSVSRDLYGLPQVGHPHRRLYTLSLWFSNSTYIFLSIFLSISFIQMLKAFMPVAVYSIGIGRDNIDNIVLISILSRYFDDNQVDMCRNIRLSQKP